MKKIAYELSNNIALKIFDGVIDDVNLKHINFDVNETYKIIFVKFKKNDLPEQNWVYNIEEDTITTDEFVKPIIDYVNKL